MQLNFTAHLLSHGCLLKRKCLYICHENLGESRSDYTLLLKNIYGKQ